MIALLVLSLLVPNRWLFLQADAAHGVRAEIRTSRLAYVSVGGVQLLDIVQVGTRNGRLFAAWGNGIPNGEGSSYTEKDLGPTSGWHRFRVRLIHGIWRLAVDGKVRLRIPDTFRHWRIRSAQAAVESETGEPMSGRIRDARTYRHGWRLPTWTMHGYHAGSTRFTFGADWLTVGGNA